MRLFLRLWASGDFTLYPEPKTPPAKWAKEMAAALSPMGLSHPVISHNPLEAIENESLERSHREKDSHFFIENEGVAVAAVPASNDTASDGDHPLERSRPDVVRLLSTPDGEILAEVKTKAKRGSGGLTSEGKKKLRSACQILEKEARGRAIGFLTLTLPTMSREMLDNATNKWAEIMRQFMQELSRECRRVGLPDDWAFCTEWQKERQALHAHIAFIAHPTLSNPNGDEYPIQKDWYRQTWKRILKNVLGENFDCKAATRIEKVKQSVGAYMSKYISKGDKDAIKCKTTVRPLEDWEIGALEESMSNIPIEAIDTAAEDVIVEVNRPHPSAWWGSCKNLKNEVKKTIETWEIKAKESDIRRQLPRADQWIESAEKIIAKLDCYWAKIIESGDGIRRAIAGRLRMKEGWKTEAHNVVFGKKFVVPPFSMNEPYWQWRYQRDKCSLYQDKFAEIDWMRKNSASVEKRERTILGGYDKFSVAADFRHPTAGGFRTIPSVNSARLGVTW